CIISSKNKCFKSARLANSRQWLITSFYVFCVTAIF
ncbi:MAG: hypothetical protein ACI89T_001873, partial [Cognaticolwellia sp.]